ncbi:MAG: M43 family zinc metalloprotease [Crocinitomicaceae bacterium]|nr:M43 family zinc metalloprotease [Crocinitomicaceae bacterium]
MKKIYLGLASLLFSTIGIGQTFNSQNARQGESVEYCRQHTLLEQYKTHDPALYNTIMQGQAQLNAEMKNSNAAKADEIYTIPVVFHIIHNGGSENISDEQIYDQVAILNRDYRRLNADADNVNSNFTGMPADVKIEFKLATKAPNGACFKGITRTVSALTVDPGGWNGGAQQLQAIFNGNDVYQGTWAHNKYLNVVVAKNIGGAAGYTMYPNGGGTASNSIFILSTYVGSIGTSSTSTSRALTHEIGHWLNLSHVWGDNNDPGQACGNDGVSDTPITKGFTFCPNENGAKVCDPNIVENYENYMDYSYCSKMFTPGQVTRMRTAITSSTGGRSNIWTTANLNAVGAVDNPPLCKAEFSSDKRIICTGQSIQFTDMSFNLPIASWTWTFDGGSPATSTAQNPVVTYNTPGVYNVKLVATRGSDSPSETKTGYIVVLEPGTGLPYFEGFEGYSNMAEATSQKKLFVNNPGNNAAFEITTTAANSGAKSIKLGNFGQSGQNLDEFTSNAIDLSAGSINNVNFSFKYAYRKRQSTNIEYLKVYFSGDCGDTWVLRKPLSSSAMTSQTATSAWTPTASDWVNVDIPFNSGVYNQFLTANFRYKFAFEGNEGNNIYIDDINLTATNAGVESLETLNNVVLYPNPNDGQVNLSFGLEAAQKLTVKVLDISGKELKSSTIQGVAGNNIVSLDNTEFTAGLYFIKLSTETTNKTIQFIKK